MNLSKERAKAIRNGLLGWIASATILATPAFVLSQNPEWIVYDTGNSGLPDNKVISIAIDPSGNKWIGTYNGGLARFDGENWTVYNTENSGLPFNAVHAFAFDTQGNTWIGTSKGIGGSSTGNGLAMFDGENWTVYNTENSVLASDRIVALMFDSHDVLWIGTVNGGITHFDGKNWFTQFSEEGGLHNTFPAFAMDAQQTLWTINIATEFAKFDGNTWTFITPPDEIKNYRSYDVSISLAIDSQGGKWMGVYEAGLIYFNGTDWTLQTPQNSLLPHESVFPIVIDSKGDKWFGTVSALGAGGGLVKYDGTNFTLFDVTNSGLPGKNVLSLAIDSYENLWIGTETGGLAVYREGGVILGPPTAIEDETNAATPTAFSLTQNFPNPFNSQTTIRFALPAEQQAELAVFDLAGQKIATLMQGQLSSGIHEVRWNGRDANGNELASGVYLYRLRAGTQTETRKLLLLQ